MGIDLKTVLFKYVIPLTPIIALVGSATFWWDTRYMKKTMDDERYIDQQIRVVNIELDVFHRLKDAGGTLTSKQQSRFEALQREAENLKAERRRQLGIAELPE